MHAQCKNRGNIVEVKNALEGHVTHPEMSRHSRSVHQTLAEGIFGILNEDPQRHHPILEGRPWHEALAGPAMVFRSREISDPNGMLSRTQPGKEETAVRDEMSPEVIGEVIEKHIRHLYADWADQPLPALDGKTQREAIQTPDGLEQVKFLLHTYEHGESRQAKAQQRPAVSYDFLWQELGITPLGR
jgi:hypothetical protein